MKKRMLILPILLVLTLGGCGKPSSGMMPSKDMTPLEELPDTYNLEQAKSDGCVVEEDGDITQGAEEMEAFWKNTKAGQKGTLRLVSYYTLGDASQYDPDYYESIKDDYPLLFVTDLSFDGSEYTIRHFEDGDEFTKSYSYLMKYEGKAEHPFSTYKSYIRYVLTNDDDLTWEDLWNGMISSQLEAYIDHYVVCTDLETVPK